MTINQIEERATDLLNKYNCSSAPVNIKQLIKKLNVNMKPDELGAEVSGLLVIENNRIVIGYNSNESLVRQRFTLAHEVGHFILHCNNSKKDKIFVDKIMFRKNFSSNIERRQEMQANIFAASLLMPKNLVEKEFELIINSSDYLTEEDIVSKMANKFKVSEIAMTYRLINLNFLQQ